MTILYIGKEFIRTMTKKISFLLVAATLAFATPCVAANSPVDSIHVVIDVGHGGVDIGTSYKNLFEKDINLQIAKLVYEELEASGYHVALNRDGDYALSDENHWLNSSSRHRRDLAQRTQLAAELSPQLLISLHVNWSSHSKANGPVVLYQKTNQSFMIADMIQHSLNQVYQMKKEPVAGKSYFLLENSSCPSVIVEMGFLSNASDRQRLINPVEQQKIAKAIKDGVNEYFMLAGQFHEDQPVDTWIGIFKRLLKKMIPR